MGNEETLEHLLKEVKEIKEQIKEIKLNLLRLNNACEIYEEDINRIMGR